MKKCSNSTTQALRQRIAPFFMLKSSMRANYSSVLHGDSPLEQEQNSISDGTAFPQCVLTASSCYMCSPSHIREATSSTQRYLELWNFNSSPQKISISITNAVRVQKISVKLIPTNNTVKPLFPSRSLIVEKAYFFSILYLHYAFCCHLYPSVNSARRAARVPTATQPPKAEQKHCHVPLLSSFSSHWPVRARYPPAAPRSNSTRSDGAGTKTHGSGG